MPLYEFQCSNCEHVFDALLPLSKSDSSGICPACGGKAGRIMSACSFKVASSGEQIRRNEESKRRSDMRFDLKERYGVEEVALLPTSEGPTTYESVYNDVVSRGSHVKDQMQETAARNAEKSRAKQKKWLEGAWSRRQEKVKEIRAQKERERAETFNKNSITVQTKKS